MINKKWDIVLKDEMTQDYFKILGIFVKNEYKTKQVFPPYENIFDALRFTDYDDVKVVILGQDPYHGLGEAHGLSFSVHENVSMPPSLQNIFKELYDDLGIPPSKCGDLTPWAHEGVLLLNSILSVRKDSPLSHKDLGWQLLTDHIIKLINLKKEHCVFILWGSFARSKKALITNKNHLVIESTHPSPFSARSGFFGSRPFSKANDYLKKNKIKEVNFTLPNHY